MRTTFAFLALTVAAPASAIVIRHDVPDSAYRANASDYAFLFPLYRSKEGYGDCIATLIAPEWALTAAHCTEDKGFTEAVARGGYPIEVAGRKTAIVQVERHPDSGGRPVDLALLRLSEPVSQIRFVALYRTADELGREVLLPGWGDPGDGLAGLGKADGHFRIAENRIDRAEAGLLTWVFDTPTGGRALPLEGISGPGDSGGPALVMTPHGWAIIGVSSAQRTFGRPEGLYGAEELYVRVSDYAAWIDSKTRGPAP